MKEIVKNSVIQVNENGPEEWIGCLMQVSEPREWGALAWVRIPFQGNAYLRLKSNQYDYIGHAVMSPQEYDETEGGNSE